jgi:hypothetical protein
MDKKQAKVDLPSGRGTISTRAEQKQVEDRQAIGANVGLRNHSARRRRGTASARVSAGLVGARCRTFDGFFVCCPGGTRGPLARSAVATVDRRYRFIRKKGNGGR